RLNYVELNGVRAQGERHAAVRSRFAWIRWTPHAIADDVEPIVSRPWLSPLVQFGGSGKWLFGKLLGVAYTPSHESTDAEMVGQGIARLRFEAVGLDSKSAAAVIIAVVGPVAFVRRRGKCQRQRNDLPLSKRGPPVRQCDGHFGICSRRGERTWVG